MMVDPDSIARIIDAFVDSLDLTGMGFTNTNPSSEGRPAYNPGSLLKLYLYGHRNNMRSSRKLQKACHVNIEAKWLMKGAEPERFPTSGKTMSAGSKTSSSNLTNALKT